MPVAISADGVRHEFPDGTDVAVIDRVMKQYAQQQAPHKPADYTGIGFVDRGINNLLTTGNLLGNRDSALAQSARISEEESKPNAPLRLRLDNPMLWAFGPGNLAGPRPPMPSPTAAAGRLEDFTAQGVTPSVPVIGQGRAAGLAAQAGRMLPFSPVGKRIEQNIGETARAAEAAASRYGQATAETGGNVAQNALKAFAADKSQAAREYGDFWRIMHGAPPAQVGQTLGVLQQIRGRFPNAPELTGLFTNSKLGRLQEALEPRTVQVPGKTSPILNQFGQPSTVIPPRTVRRGGALSVPELKELKSQIGYMLENPSPPRPDSIPRAQLKQLYGAVSRDVQMAAAQRGPAAVRALVKADRNYATRLGMIDRLSGMIDKDAPEAVFGRLNAAAGNAGSADYKLLNTAKKAMPASDWNGVASSFVRRLGNPTPGAVRMAGQPEFSVDIFATNWNKISSRAKDILFGSDVPGSPRAGLEQLARVSNTIKNVGKLANVSHTAEVGKVASAITYVLGNLAAGRVPAPELAGLAGGYGVSKLLMSPAFTRFMYRAPNAIGPSRTAQEANAAAFAALRQAVVGEAGSERQRGAAPSQKRPAAPMIYTPSKPRSESQDYIEPPSLRPSVTGP